MGERPSTAPYIWPLASKQQIAADGPVILSKGDGSRVTDVSGNTYLDLSSGITRASALGHGNRAIANAVHEQLRKLHYAGTAEYQADVVFRLARKLADLTPGALGASYFTESGTAANEAAFKLARHYQRATGKPRAYKRWNVTADRRWGRMVGCVRRKGRSVVVRATGGGGPLLDVREIMRMRRRSSPSR